MAPNTIYKNGFLVVSHAVNGVYGTANILAYSDLEVGDTGRTIEGRVTNAYRWDIAFESVDLPDHTRSLPPQLRPGLTTYIPYSFSGLNCLQVVGGRFFCVKRPFCISKGHVVTTDYDQGGEGMVTKDMAETLPYLKDLLPRLGLVPPDLTRVHDNLYALLSDFEDCI